jgi:deazaflavin-dependent oxidoreductase (nitroreductase family)
MFGELKRRLYPNNRPNALARFLNRFWAIVHATGLASADWVTLEVTGRKSGRPVSLPVVVAVVDGQRYLVSMLGEDAQWVRNVRAAGGKAAILSGGRKAVRLVEVPASQRAPILKVYLQHAPGARPHVPVNKDAPVAAFEKIAADYPVFRIEASA